MSIDETNELKRLTETIQQMRFQELHRTMSCIEKNIIEIKNENKDFRDRLITLENKIENCPLDVYKQELQRFGRETRTIRALGYFFNQHPKFAWMVFLAVVILLAAALPTGIKEFIGVFNGH